ncbi:MAG: ABC transporter permease [Cyclobacteriaceae bacterium]
MSEEQQSPPEFWLKFFLWFCRRDCVEDIEGDLIERYELRRVKVGHKIAAQLFRNDVLKLFRPSMIKNFEGNQKLNQYGMLKHNLLVSFRSFLRYKTAFLINLIGLSTGLACALFIYLWVQDEYAVDKFHVLDEQLYQVMLHHEESGALNTGTDTPGLLAEALEEEIPEITSAVQSTPSFWFGKMPLTLENKTIKADGQFVGAKYFELFSFPLIHGNAGEVLKDKKSIAISESLAKSLFDSPEAAMGQTLNWSLFEFNEVFQVSGVFADLPPHSTENFDFLLSFDVFEDMVGGGIQWGNYNAHTFITAADGTDLDLLNEKLAGFIKGKRESSNVIVFARKYSDGYLNSAYENGHQSGGRIEYVQLFTAISIFILLIACINFMNLSTAKASRKTKEVGVKKAIGASRSALIIQFMSESFIMTLISIVVALGLVLLLLPQFNLLTGKAIQLFLDGQLLLNLAIILLFTGFVAGSYPALYLSKFRPAEVLKGQLRSSVGEFWVRKGLVVFQFTLSVVLIVAVMVVHQQIQFVQNKNLGYQKENVILFPNEGKIAEKQDDFIARLKNTPGVINVSGTSHTIVNGGSYTTGVSWEGQNPDVQTRFGNMSVHYDFLETLGMELIEGRAFSKDLNSEHEKLIFNETAIRLMGITDPIGKKVNLWGDDREIIGVAKDFHFESLHEPITPLFFKLLSGPAQTIVARIAPQNQFETFERIESVFQEYNPSFNFNFQFLDAEYEKQYAAENVVAVLSRYFAGITILISCLGLFGLASFTAERRFKEIGIRKALGATSFSIVKLLSADFNKMIAIAVFIALPLSYYLVNLWLEGFAYTINLAWYYFIAAGLSSLFIAWLTVALQTMKAAKLNPVQSLRSE